MVAEGSNLERVRRERGAGLEQRDDRCVAASGRIGKGRGEPGKAFIRIGTRGERRLTSMTSPRFTALRKSVVIGRLPIEPAKDLRYDLRPTLQQVVTRPIQGVGRTSMDTTWRTQRAGRFSSVRIN